MRSLEEQSGGLDGRRPDPLHCLTIGHTDSDNDDEQQLPSKSRNGDSTSSLSGTKKEKQERSLDFQDVDETGKWGSVSRQEIIGVVVTLLFVVAGVATAIFILLGRVAAHGKAGSGGTGSSMNAPTPEVVRDTTYYSVEAQYQALREAIQARAVAPNNTTTTNAAQAAMERAEIVATILTHLVPNVDDLVPVDPYSQAAYWFMNIDESPTSVESDLLPRFVMAVTYYANGGDSTSASIGSDDDDDDANSTSNSNSNNATLTSSSWNNTDQWMTYADQCEWHGVTCNTQQQIVEVDLSYNGLVGNLHAAWLLLDSTTSIMLSGNQITGTIPGAVFGGMPSLTYLHLDDNVLTGTVPSTLKQASRLDTLFLQKNNLTGVWPSEFCPANGAVEYPFAEFAVDCLEVDCACCDGPHCFD